MSFAYLASKPCGCVVGTAVIGSIEPKELGAVVGKWIGAAHLVDRKAVDEIDLASMTCIKHRTGVQGNLFDGINAAAAEAKAATAPTLQPPAVTESAERTDCPELRVNPKDNLSDANSIIESWCNDEGALCGAEVTYAVIENEQVRPGYALVDGADGREFAILLDDCAPTPDLHEGRVCLQCLKRYDQEHSVCECGELLYWKVLTIDAKQPGWMTNSMAAAAAEAAEDAPTADATDDDSDEEGGEDE